MTVSITSIDLLPSLLAHQLHHLVDWRNFPPELAGNRRSMSQSSDVAKLLQDLGNTPAEVASALRVKGIQGVRNTVRTLNPVVRYVLALASDVWNLNIVGGNTLSMNFRDGRKRSVALPEAVKEFLDSFNQGSYSDLELPT